MLKVIKVYYEPMGVSSKEEDIVYYEKVTIKK